MYKLAIAAIAATTLADTPANCMVEEIYGIWDFHIGSETDKVNCENWSIDDTEHIQTINLRAPNIAEVLSPENQENGHWTMIYNEGFEVNVGTHSFFAFVWYSGTDFRCTDTMPGYLSFWAGKERRCFMGIKRNQLKTFGFKKENKKLLQNNLESPFKVDNELVSKINNIPGLSWHADNYQNMWNTSMTLKEAKKFQGPFVKEKILHSFQKSEKVDYKAPASFSDRNVLEQKPNFIETGHNGAWRRVLDEVPDSWDWRNVDGVNYVSPVRHQDMCGSCYIFASAAELEARIRISTNNQNQPVLSPQAVIDCSPYGQGCNGGFPYLIAGRWAHDWGFVDEACYPYEGKDAICRDSGLKDHLEPKLQNVKFNECGQRYYTWMYRYVGWFFGNCNEQKMKEEIYRHGPIAVGFEVLDDFRYYKGGIYRHTGLKSEVNQVGNGFEVTNHAVTIVGYGHCDKENADYWIVKNSWGDQWGEEGYFRILRGVDEVAIESMAQASYVVQPL